MIETSFVEDIIDRYNLVLPMKSAEFASWLGKDRYGNDCVDEPAVLNFLSIISSEAGWEEKESLIYKFLIDENG